MKNEKINEKTKCLSCNGKGTISYAELKHLSGIDFPGSYVCNVCKGKGYIKTPKIDVSDYVQVGRNNAKSRRQLKEEMNIDDRAMRNLFSEARLNGVPLISVGNGYYIADLDDEEDKMELLIYLNQLKARINNMNDTVAILMQYLYDEEAMVEIYGY